jgi:hypothetical protein
MQCRYHQGIAACALEILYMPSKLDLGVEFRPALAISSRGGFHRAGAITFRRTGVSSSHGGGPLATSYREYVPPRRIRVFVSKVEKGPLVCRKMQYLRRQAFSVRPTDEELPEDEGEI